MHAFTEAEAFMIGIMLNGVLWGYFTAIFIFFLVILVKQPKKTKRYTIPNIAIFILYLLCTAFFALAVQRLLEGFIFYQDELSAVDCFLAGGQFHSKLIAATLWIYSLITVIGDSVLVWRCNTLWGRKFWFVTLIPALMIAITAVGGVGTPSVLLATASPVLKAKIAPLGASFAKMLIGASLMTNLTTTLLIAGRIWWLSFGPKGSSSYSFTNKRIVKVLSLVCESGMILTAVKIIEFALLLLSLDSTQQEVYLVWECVPQTVGIVPTMIVIAVTTGYTSLSSKDDEQLNFGTVILTTNPIHLGSNHSITSVQRSSQHSKVDLKADISDRDTKHERDVSTPLV